MAVCFLNDISTPVNSTIHSPTTCVILARSKSQVSYLFSRIVEITPVLSPSYKFKTRYLDDSLFNAYPYWIAHYYVDSVRYEGKWHFWQHTDIGSVPGIHHDEDLNVFNGSLEDLRKMTMR